MRKYSKVAGLVLGGLLVIGLGSGAIARTNAASYDTQTAVNIPLPVSYTFAFSMTNSINRTVNLPFLGNKTNPNRITDTIRLDGLDILRVEDWSTGVNVNTVNLTAYFYSDVITTKSISVEGTTQNRWVTGRYLTSTRNMVFGEDFHITNNAYSLAEIFVTRNTSAPVRVTLNVTARRSKDIAVGNATMNIVVLPATTITKLTTKPHTSVAIDNSIGTATVWVAPHSAPAVNTGYGLKTGTAIAMDGSMSLWGYSATATTVNVVETY